jgi:cytochrome c biogenesis protein CcmG, thiol:disulfide interchange protein DsbE
MKRSKLVGGLLVLVAVAAVLALTRSFRLEARGVEVGERVPEYSAPDLAGGEVSFEDHIGEVVLVNIWATWCGPCRVEMPPIKAIYERNKDKGFTVLAISIDAGPGYREKVRQFAEEHGLDFPILLDPEGRISQLFQTVGVPETFVLDRQGRIAKRLIGATNWDSPGNQALIDELLRM